VGGAIKVIRDVAIDAAVAGMGGSACGPPDQPESSSLAHVFQDGAVASLHSLVPALPFTDIEKCVSLPAVQVAMLLPDVAIGKDEHVGRLRRGADPSLTATSVAGVQFCTSDSVPGGE